MNAIVSSRNIELKRFVKRSLLGVLKFRLRRFAKVIQSASLTICDVNGPKGGVDTSCSLRLKLASRGEIVTTAEAENAMAAARVAVGRALAVLKKRNQKERAQRLRSHRRLSFAS